MHDSIFQRLVVLPLATGLAGALTFSLENGVGLAALMFLVVGAYEFATKRDDGIDYSDYQTVEISRGGLRVGFCPNCNAPRIEDRDQGTGYVCGDDCVGSLPSYAEWEIEFVPVNEYERKYL